jgi:hypothetical protein
MATKVTLYIAFDGREFKERESAEKYNKENSDKNKKLIFSNLYKDNKQEFAKLLGINLSDLDNRNFNWSSYNDGDLQGAVIELISKNIDMIGDIFGVLNSTDDKIDDIIDGFKPNPRPIRS